MGVCGPCGGRYPAFVLTVKKESEMLKVERFFFLALMLEFCK